ncbi:MAG: ParB/RepB/Spo0J family partition protein [Candidatus Kuenenia sp.]|nr:ParB/RepB/Spo0J family partition protein [Candidatus Kuenenia hertensis]
MPRNEKLSKGLQSLLGGVIGIEAEKEQGVIIQLNPSDVKPNNLQPRNLFKEAEMQDLIASIKKHGILQPIIVTPLSHGYMLIAGERRWRAAKELGMKKVPAIIRQADSANILELALIENIQREDLNPIEKALGFRELINKFGFTQEQVAQAMGKNRSSVTNYLRLLELPDEIQNHVSRGTISMGHARALLSLQGKEMQLKYCDSIIKDGLSVRDIEAIAAGEKNAHKPTKQPTKKMTTPHIADIEDRFRKHFGTKVKIRERQGRGQITITFNNNDEFERIANKSGIIL